MMRVDEPREQDAALKVDDPGCTVRDRGRIRDRSDGEYLSPADRERLNGTPY